MYFTIDNGVSIIPHFRVLVRGFILVYPHSYCTACQNISIHAVLLIHFPGEKQTELRFPLILTKASTPTQPFLKSKSLLRYREVAFFSTSRDLTSWLSWLRCLSLVSPLPKLPIDRLSCRLASEWDD